MVDFQGTDFTYCSSKNCQDKCGRKLKLSVEKRAKLDKDFPDWGDRIWTAYFCDDLGEVIK